MELREILSRCDHTLLRVDATAAEIRALCDQGMRYGCASVCIPPCHVAGRRNMSVTGCICTVIGFPNGVSHSGRQGVRGGGGHRNGADEVDVVVNLAMVKDGCWTMSRPISAPCVRSAAAVSSRSSSVLPADRGGKSACSAASSPTAELTYQDLHRLFHRRRHGGRCVCCAPAARRT